MKTTLGQLLINDSLPDDLKDHSRVLDRKNLQALLRQVAQNHPEKYVEISKKLADIGRFAATESGGNSFGVEHLKKSPAGQRHQAQLQASIDQILNNDSLTDQQRDDALIHAAGSHQKTQADDVYKDALASGNPLAMQVLSGAKGNRMNLSSLLGSDLLYSDHRGNIIPAPITRSFSQGLDPASYWASTYGARKGLIDVKFAVRDSGALSKQLNQVNHRLMVVDDDDPRTDQEVRGMPVDTEDPDNEGSLLATDHGPYRKNTAITPKIQKHLAGLGHSRLLVRSPIIGGSPEGGVYARDVGVREDGRLPGRGSQSGLTAAQSISEPLSQGALGSKHVGGVAGGAKSVSGFERINQLIQSPKTIKGGATHSEVDGRVESIEPAPAGGVHVKIHGESHYVSRGLDLKVKPGDDVEAGDVISEGEPRAGTIVKHKGIGEGRRYFVKAMREAMADAGITAHRRNIELLVRGLINHVRLTEETPEHVPDDIVSYSTLEHSYVPRDGATLESPGNALNKYLEKPVLHYSLGTKIRPSVVRELRNFKIDKIHVHHEPAPFEPEMIRGASSIGEDPDWLTRMYGSGLKAGLLDAVHHGTTSDETGTSFVPGLARAVDFGRKGLVRSPEPGKKPDEVDEMGHVTHQLDFSKTHPVSVRIPHSSGSANLHKLSADLQRTQDARALLTKMAAVLDDLSGTKPKISNPSLPKTPAPATPTVEPTAPAPSAAVPAAKPTQPGGYGDVLKAFKQFGKTMGTNGGTTNSKYWAPPSDGTTGEYMRGDNPFGGLGSFLSAVNPEAYATLTRGPHNGRPRTAQPAAQPASVAEPAQEAAPAQPESTGEENLFSFPYGISGRSGVPGIGDPYQVNKPGLSDVSPLPLMTDSMLPPQWRPRQRPPDHYEYRARQQNLHEVPDRVRANLAAERQVASTTTPTPFEEQRTSKPIDYALGHGILGAAQGAQLGFGQMVPSSWFRRWPGQLFGMAAERPALGASAKNLMKPLVSAKSITGMSPGLYGLSFAVDGARDAGRYLGEIGQQALGYGTPGHVGEIESEIGQKGVQTVEQMLEQGSVGKATSALDPMTRTRAYAAMPQMHTELAGRADHARQMAVRSKQQLYDYHANNLRTLTAQARQGRVLNQDEQSTMATAQNYLTNNPRPTQTGKSLSDFRAPASWRQISQGDFSLNPFQPGTVGHNVLSPWDRSQ